MITWMSALDLKDLVLEYGFIEGYGETPFGTAYVLLLNRNPDFPLCALAFGDRDLDFPFSLEGTRVRDDDLVQSLLDKIPQYSSMILAGTEFQHNVWKALLKTQEGETLPYQSLASSMGIAHKTRAVANAIGRNPISWIVPCHRIVRKSGQLGGYRWGLPAKEQLLEFEQHAKTT